MFDEKNLSMSLSDVDSHGQSERKNVGKHLALFRRMAVSFKAENGCDFYILCRKRVELSKFLKESQKYFDFLCFFVFFVIKIQFFVTFSQ